MNVMTAPMVDEEKDAALGKAMRLYKEAHEQLAKLRAEAKFIGNVFSKLGQGLAGSPELLLAQGQPHESRFHGGTTFNLAEVATAERIVALTSEIRTKIVEIGDLQKALGKMGYPVPSLRSNPLF